VEVAAFIRCVFLCLISEMGDWFLEQRINIKFCVKLEKNVTLGQCFLRLTGRSHEKVNVFDWYKLSKESLHVKNHK